MLLQYPDDLLFRIPALLHLWSSPSHYERTPAAIGRDFRGQVRAPVTNSRGARGSNSGFGFLIWPRRIEPCGQTEIALIWGRGRVGDQPTKTSECAVILATIGA